MSTNIAETTFKLIENKTNSQELLSSVSTIIDQAIAICGSALDQNGETIPSVLDYVEAFSGDADFRAKQKSDFLSGKIDNPVLNEHTQLGDNFERRKRVFNELGVLQTTLESLRTELGYIYNNNEDNEYQKIKLEIDLGIDLIKRYKSIIASMQAAYLLSLHNPEIGPKTKLLNSNEALLDKLPEDISEWMSEAYFKPSPVIANQILQQVQQEDLQVIDAVSPELLTADENAIELFVPSQETLDYYGDLLRGRYSKLFDEVGIEVNIQFDREGQKVIIEQILDKLGLTDKGWTVKIDDSKTGFSIENAEKVFRIGKRGKDGKIEGLDFQAKLVHELMHLLRYQNAEDNEDFPSIAKKGLPGYLDFEEAFGGFLESCWKGKYNPDVYEYRYLAGAYAQGAVDGRFHDFRTCFDFVLNYAIKKIIKAGDQKQIAGDQIEITKSVVYDAVLRFFRGMPLDPEGANDFSGFTYLAGVNRVGKVLAPESKSGQIKHLDEDNFWKLWGLKYDPSKYTDVSFAKMLAAASRINS